MDGWMNVCLSFLWATAERSTFLREEEINMDGWWHAAALNSNPHLTPDAVSQHKSASESWKKKKKSQSNPCMCELRGCGEFSGCQESLKVSEQEEG